MSTESLAASLMRSRTDYVPPACSGASTTWRLGECDSSKTWQPVRLHPNLAEVYRGKVERLQGALNDSGIRDEALQILQALIERVSITPTDTGLDVEIVGEIAKMVELGIGNDAKPCDPGRNRNAFGKGGCGARSHLYRTRFRYEREARK
jgi:hypothetical protein